MYQSHFGLTRQAFSATPDADSCAGVPTMKNAFESLVRCLADGRGIGVVTAPAGLGKTILCQTIADELGNSFATVLLPNSNFSTRQSLLQAIACELGQPYVRLSEQELRLELISAVRSLPPRKVGVALLIDEAHLLSGRLLEEARTLTNLFDDGEPLVRLLLSGQLSLEENLTATALEALNQRIGCHVTLEPLSRQESADYIAFRLSRSGADPTGVFSEEALSLICLASDGVPRCLNQLCDHSLQLAFLSDERLVSPDTVRTALDDLKQLPLHWNELSPARSPVGTAVEQLTPNRQTGELSLEPASRSTADDFSDEVSTAVDLATEVFECGDGVQTTECIEIGGDEPSSPGDSAPDGDDGHHTGIDAIEVGATLEIGDNDDASGTFQIGGEACDNPVSMSTIEHDSVEVVSTGHDVCDEEAVVDPYARLDAEYARSDHRTASRSGEKMEVQQTIEHSAAIAETCPPQQDIMTRVLDIRHNIESDVEASLSVSESIADENNLASAEAAADSIAEADDHPIHYEYDVVHPEPDDAPSARIETSGDDESLNQASGRRSASRRRQSDELVRELRRRYRKQA